MKCRFFLTLFFICCNQFIFADTLTLLKKIDANVSFFTTDHLGNCYLVTESGLHKYDQDGNLLASFTEKSFGAIQFVDATDPLKVLVFNTDFSSVNTLDTKLNIQASFNLRELGLQQPVLICMSRHDGYWVFDKQTNQLKKFNSSLQLIFESSDITQLINVELNPVYLVESEKWLWLNNPSSGVIIFDTFGTYLKTLDTKEAGLAGNFQVNDDKIIFTEGNSLKEINQAKFTTKEITYTELNEVIKMRIEQNRLYVFKKDSFGIYSF